MIRTQIYLPEKLHQQLHDWARYSGHSFSELIRQGAEMVIKKQAKQKPPYPPLELPSFKSNKPLPKKLDRQTIYEL